MRPMKFSADRFPEAVKYAVFWSKSSDLALVSWRFRSQFLGRGPPDRPSQAIKNAIFPVKSSDLALPKAASEKKAS